ncbi:GNAT family N-acetyltransferase [Aquimarina sp. 2201CG5-10]|uniref:GNAT family N-acetyltransferase n=1 Tax=Aquimarina callyspongiae TaxID=3098150 RepID=UPI002AB400C1|nr:GNAT family N-acetyltransferase [Aquimarina sp. 2201CG5-10]MDY8137154.1 GNAT family N-acetyltransferase [Aquimarina sp. 2201CG5-10]
MDFISKTYQTKSNKPITVREAIPEDATQLLKLKHQYLKDTNTIPLFDYEYSNTIKEECELIKNYHKQQNSILLVAEYKGIIVGNIDLTGSWRKKMQHTAVIGMGIHTQWQNQGLGTLLIQNVMDWSKTNDLLKTIWLEVYETNNAGRTLYKKSGFKEVGRIKNFFHEKQKYIDKIIMSIEVSEN